MPLKTSAVKCLQTSLYFRMQSFREPTRQTLRSAVIQSDISARRYSSRPELRACPVTYVLSKVPKCSVICCRQHMEQDEGCAIHFGRRCRLAIFTNAVATDSGNPERIDFSSRRCKEQTKTESKPSHAKCIIRNSKFALVGGPRGNILLRKRRNMSKQRKRFHARE